MDLKRLEAAVRRSNPVADEDYRDWGVGPAGRRVWRRVLAAREAQLAGDARQGGAAGRGRAARWVRPSAMALAVAAAVVLLALGLQPGRLGDLPPSTAEAEPYRPVTRLEAVRELGQLLAQTRTNLPSGSRRPTVPQPILERFGEGELRTPLPGRDLIFLTRAQLALLVWELLSTAQRAAVPAGLALPVDWSQESGRLALNALRYVGFAIPAGDGQADAPVLSGDLALAVAFVKQSLAEDPAGPAEPR